MNLVVTPYVIMCVITTLFAVAVAVVARRRSEVPGGKPLFWLMVSVAIWAFAVSFEYASTTIPGKVFWAVIEYIGVTTCPVFFLLVALEYNRMDKWLTRGRVIGLFILPAITWLLALTNDWHHLIWTTFTPSQVGENLDQRSGLFLPAHAAGNGADHFGCFSLSGSLPPANGCSGGRSGGTLGG
jgi:hypothetical protein